MKRTLVIGGTLFIGRGLVRRLLERGDDVTILHRGAHNPFGKDVREAHADRNDGEAAARILREGNFELVFDNVYDWQRGTPAAAVETAARACGDALERYVFMSSVAAYQEGLDLDEDAPLAPPDDGDAYCRNKADTERMLFRLHAENGFPATTLRPPYIYGPENPFYREQFFWDRIVAGRPVIVPGDGSRLMQFAFVKDLVQAALAAADRPGAVGRAYNIAHEAPVAQRELVIELAKAAGRPAPELVFVPREQLAALGGRAFEPPYYFAQYFDMPAISERIARARAELGFEPTPFADGLRASYEWYVSQDRVQADFSFDDKVLAAVR